MADEARRPWMTVSFTPTLDDVGAYLRHLAAQSVQFQDSLRRARNMGYIMGGAIAGPILAASALSFTPAGRWLEPYLRYGTPTLGAVALVILVFLGLRFRFRLGSRGQLARSLEEQARTGKLETDLRATTVSIDESGLLVDRGTSRYWHAWTVVQRLVEFEGRLMIHYTRDQAVTVPVRAFETSERAAEFRRLVETNLRRDVRTGVSPPTVAAKT